MKVVVHNHPKWGTIWAAAGRIPPAYEQIGAFISDDDIAFHHEYEGAVVDTAAAEANVTAFGSAVAGYLANHGVIVVGRSIPEAYYRCVSLETRSRIAWHVQVLGGGAPFPTDQHEALSSRLRKVGVGNLFESAARWEIDRDPNVLN